jgi:hypothetical protein
VDGGKIRTRNVQIPDMMKDRPGSAWLDWWKRQTCKGLIIPDVIEDEEDEEIEEDDDE